MAFEDNYRCRNCFWWEGNREGLPDEKGDCHRFPDKIKNKLIDDHCAEWKNFEVRRAGLPVDPPEWPP